MPKPKLNKAKAGPKPKLIIGVDEAGRGPLAGPVAVGVVLVPLAFPWQRLLPGVDDSKRLTARARMKIFQLAKELKNDGQLDYKVSLCGAKTIDRLGINRAVSLALSRALARLHHTKRPGGFRAEDLFSASVRLDGGLRAPSAYLEQQTIIGGDRLEPAISLASIMAKVTRDQYMVNLALNKAYQPYDFARHKGYGTLAHRRAILERGLSPEHRRSYCRRVIAD